MPPRPVEVEVEGKKYEATYTVSGGKHPDLTLSSQYGTKTASVGTTPWDDLAQMLLLELVGERLAKEKKAKAKKG